MNSKSKATPTILVMADPRMGGLPYILEPENVDNWPNQEVRSEYFLAIDELISLGYRGVRVDRYKLSDGRHIKNIYMNPNSTEGQLIKMLYLMARQGEHFSIHDVRLYLEHAYCELGLPAPVPFQRAV